jgi:hypothetical protein
VASMLGVALMPLWLIHIRQWAKTAAAAAGVRIIFRTLPPTLSNFRPAQVEIPSIRPIAQPTLGIYVLRSGIGEALMFATRKLLLLLLGLALMGCIHTQELPLAPNMVRLDTQASGLLFAGQATNQTMRRVAELTLQNGFTHFRFEQASLQQGSQMAGVYSSGSATAHGTTNMTTLGNTGYATTNVMATPIYKPTSRYRWSVPIPA